MILRLSGGFYKCCEVFDDLFDDFAVFLRPKQNKFQHRSNELKSTSRAIKFSRELLKATGKFQEALDAPTHSPHSDLEKIAWRLWARTRPHTATRKLARAFTPQHLTRTRARARARACAYACLRLGSDVSRI